MSSSSSNSSDKTRGGLSIATLLQVIFAICYYADPCRKDASKDCSTLIGNWEPWQVWLPYIISAGILAVVMVSGCCIMGWNIYKQSGNSAVPPLTYVPPMAHYQTPLSIVTTHQAETDTNIV